MQNTATQALREKIANLVEEYAGIAQKPDTFSPVLLLSLPPESSWVSKK